MNAKIFGRLFLYFGLIMAVGTAFFQVGGWANDILLILGVLTGFFHFREKDLLHLVIVYLGIYFTKDSLFHFPLIGREISSIALAWSEFLGPVVLVSMLYWGTPKLFQNQFSPSD